MNGKHQKVKISEPKRRHIRERKRTEEELKALARSWLARPIHPIVCRPDLTVADGNSRLDGLELLGEAEVEVFVTADDLTDDEMTEIGLVTAYHRAPLEPYEQAKALKAMKDARKISSKELAAKLNMPEPKVSRLLALWSCQPEVIEAAKSGLIGETDWAEIGQVKGDLQLGSLDLRLRGASRDELRQHVREQKTKATKKTQAPASPIGDLARRIKLPPVGKATVLVAAEGKDAEGKGEEISLDEALEAVRQAERHIKAAMAKGISARTAAAFFKDIAAAG